MPSTYAHDLFGKKVLAALPQELQDQIRQEEDLFSIGLQGPDILFYYDPVRKNTAAEEGTRMHNMSGRDFFTRMNEVVESLKVNTIPENGEKKAQTALVYVYGTLCHYALDVSCHKYVNAFAAKSSVTHEVIEGEFDRSLIVSEGRNPIEENMTQNFHPSTRSAVIISKFYEKNTMAEAADPRFKLFAGQEIATRTIETSLKRFVLFHRILHCEGGLKREALYSVFRVMGKYDRLSGHVVGTRENPACVTSNARLRILMDQAVEKAVRMISSFPEGLKLEDYALTFNGIPASCDAECGAEAETEGRHAVQA